MLLSTERNGESLKQLPCVCRGKKENPTFRQCQTRLSFEGDVINNKGDQKHEESLLVISHARYNWASVSSRQFILFLLAGDAS